MEVNIEGLWSGSFVSYCIFMSLSLNRLFFLKKRKIFLVRVESVALALSNDSNNVETFVNIS